MVLYKKLIYLYGSRGVKGGVDMKSTGIVRKVDELGRVGEITIEDLAECYTVTENEGYIKITELEE